MTSQFAGLPVPGTRRSQIQLVLFGLRHALRAFALLGGAALLADERGVDFDRDVRPVLASKCFQCHGPDAAQRQADLRLDQRESVMEDRDEPLIVPGDAAASVLFHRVTTIDTDLRMPPPEYTLELTESEIRKIRAWIDAGANWSQHWSFVPPRRPVPPAVQHAEWVRNPIDAFVASRLEQAGLQPNPRADRRTLIRRVTLDLTGLPPTPDEVDAFLNDTSPTAWETVVDRLLASPAYGQRMAWDWLDAARYADTDGFQGDPTRSMWPWRDWLVDALNQNKPFDEFTIEMLAGDLLPDATEEQILATGFNRNHMYNGEGGRIAEETRVENVFDRTETTATVWLGLTMTCCRCHDHKFDPVSQAEYYRMYALFNNTSESGRGATRGQAPPSRKYLTPEQRTQRAELEEQIAEFDQLLTAPNPDVDAAQRDWEQSIVQRLPAAADVDLELRLSEWQQTGPIPAADDSIGNAEIAAFLQAAANSETLPLLDPSRGWKRQPAYADGRVHPLADIGGATYLVRTLDSPTVRTVELSFGSDDYITVWLNGDEPVLDVKEHRIAAADQNQATVDLVPGRNMLLIRIENIAGSAGFYFRVAGESVDGVPLKIARMLRAPVEKRDAADQRSIQQFYRAQHMPEWQQANAQKTQLQQRRDQLLTQAPTVMVMDALPVSKRRETRILDKGIYNKPTDETVMPGVPTILHAPPESGVSNRLDLARWLMDPSNPLTARVTVNRSWQQFFGRGLVSTTEDFGQTGSRPTHPQLLDWLAREFVDSGWDVKHLHKLLVMTATYQQSSRRNDSHCLEQALAVDSDNTLLWCLPRYRMPSWMLRDQALAVSGLLNPATGGPSVKPYQPAGIWAEATFGKIRYQPDSGDDLYRRSLYVFWRRIVGPPMFFDAGKRQTCLVKPTRTNTPLHALTTLNETAWVEAARAMAERVLQQPAETDADRVGTAFRIALSRPPTAAESALLGQRLSELQEAYTRHPDQAEQLLAVGASARAPALNTAQHAAWTVICSTIMNLDEFLTRE